MRKKNLKIFCLSLLIILSASLGSAEISNPPDISEKSEASLITTSFRNISIVEAFEMLSKKEQVNIILDKTVSGEISLSLYKVTLEEAISAIADAGGYSVARRHKGFLILPKGSKTDDTIIQTFELKYAIPSKVQEVISKFVSSQTKISIPAGQQKLIIEDSPDSLVKIGKLIRDMDKEGANFGTTVKSFELKYAPVDKIQAILAKYISEQGKINVLSERRIIVVEDTAESMERIINLVNDLDKETSRQLMIEAKILEITLTDAEKFGMDWNKILKGETTGNIKLSGMANSTSGFLFNLTNANITLALNALSEKGRVATLSAPKLFTIENEEASVIIGDRQGYKVTTTINQVTTESINFLDSGVILKVKASVDKEGFILMSVHPEISTGSISNGIPAQTTTAVTTEIIARDGEPIFIGGLIKTSTKHNRNGIPLLKEIPVLGNLFSNLDESLVRTETVILITPHIVNQDNKELLDKEKENFEEKERKINDDKVWTGKKD